MTGPANPTFVWNPIASGPEGPGRRSRHVLAHDRAAKATVLFGGVLWNAGWNLLSDTWELWDGKWLPILFGDHPAARHRGAMVYDARRGQCVLFGGQTKEARGFVTLDDTWTYSAQRWRQWSGRGPRPGPRCGQAMAFDEEAGVVVLFGGAAGRSAESLGDTWLFDGGAWRLVAGPAPPPRRYAALAYDPGLRGCVLNGGSIDDDGARGYGDAWLFRDRTWTRLPTEFDTEVHDDHNLAYHRAAKRLVMFGGLGGPHGVRVREAPGWRRVEASPLPPRGQCSPLVWDDGLDGLVCHGGEARHEGPQFDVTWVLRLAEPSTAQAMKQEYGHNG